MNKKSIGILTLAVATLAALSIITISNQENVLKSNPKEVQQTLGEYVLRYAGRDGLDAFSLLEETADIKYENYDFGKLVTEINGIKNTQDKFWLFYINGEPATVGADSHITKDGDLIEWRYEGMK